MSKTMTREEIAYLAGVDRRTLYDYLKLHEQELRKLGMRPRARLPPIVVEWLVDNYGVVIDD
jgi:hypothetical protein